MFPFCFIPLKIFILLFIFSLLIIFLFLSLSHMYSLSRPLHTASIVVNYFANQSEKPPTYQKSVINYTAIHTSFLHPAAFDAEWSKRLTHVNIRHASAPPRSYLCEEIIRCTSISFSTPFPPCLLFLLLVVASSARVKTSTTTTVMTVYSKWSASCRLSVGLRQRQKNFP